MLLAPSLIHQVLSKRDVITRVNNHGAVYRMIKTSWGDSNEEMAKTIPENAIFGPIHGVLRDMMKEDFVVPALSGTVKAVEDNISTMVSGLASPVDMTRWERTSEVEVAPPDRGYDLAWVAEANLYNLIRDFVGDLTTGVLMGTDFAANFPNILEDVWALDKVLIPLLLGAPEWLPSMRAGVRARSRIQDAIKEHHIAYLKHVRGEEPGSRWENMDDVSSVMKNRILVWEEHEASIDVSTRAQVPILWAMNVNAPVVIFWMVWYIFSNPALLQEIREEVAPYVKVRKQDSFALGGIKEKEKAEIDLEGLRKKCPLLQGAFLETMRIETAGSSYKYVKEELMLEESEEDAVIFGRSKDDRRKYVFNKGEYLVVPHSFHQNDERYFSNPEKFDARRFWIQEGEKGGDGAVRVDYKTMRPWGGGNEVCKGRKFAEYEVVLFVAAVATFWEIEPAAEKPWYAGLGEDLGGVVKMGGQEKGEWRHPGRWEGAGAVQPKNMKNCRVKIWRREVPAA